MDSREPESIRKRQNGHENDETSSDPKRQQPNSPELKITDLNDYCLEKIFVRLDFHNLFNVAMANEWLRPAARFLYKRKFGNKTVVINLFPIRRNADEYYENIRIDSENVTINDFKNCLQFLRCFGSSISNVHIFYDLTKDKRYDYIHQYINNYCAESLLKIEFFDKIHEFSINGFEKPFVNVQTVALHDFYLDDQFSSLSQWFPNARTLKLFGIVHKDNRSIDLPLFHHLEHVRIEVHNGVKFWGPVCAGFTKTETARLLTLSNQLKSLEICTSPNLQKMTMRSLLNIIEGKPAMEKLMLKMGLYRSAVKPMEMQRLINEYPMLIELHLENFKFTVENALNLIHQLKFLKTFHFQLNNRSEYTRFASQLDGDQWLPAKAKRIGGEYSQRIYVQLHRRN